jgi:hypothetical protein
LGQHLSVVVLLTPVAHPSENNKKSRNGAENKNSCTRSPTTYKNSTSSSIMHGTTHHRLVPMPATIFMNAHLSLPLPVARAALPSLVFHHALVTSIAGCPGCTAFPSLVFHHARRQSTDEYSTGNSTVCLVITEHVTPSLTVRPILGQTASWGGLTVRWTLYPSLMTVWSVMELRWCEQAMITATLMG